MTCHQPSANKAILAALGFCSAVTLSMIAPSMIALASAEQPRGVVELFTSQGCSSCPPADKVLGDLAADPTMIALSMPIDYWDYLGWKDTLADPRFTARQKAYSLMRGDRDVYTPQAVVNGTVHVLGSDRSGIEQAVTQTGHSKGVMAVPVTITKASGHLNVSVPAANAVSENAEVWVCAVSKSVPITINKGENRGHQVTYHNVVRNMLKVGDWNGKSSSWTVPMENLARDGVDAVVVFVQDGTREKPGPMMGAAYTSLR